MGKDAIEAEVNDRLALQIGRMILAQHAQGGRILELEQENARLRAEIAALKSAPAAG